MSELKPMIDAVAARLVSAPSGWETREIKTVFASDLISDMLMAEGENILLITSLLSDQVLRTADVIGASAVVFVNRRNIPAMLGKAAVKQGLPLFHTALPKFDTCVCLGRLMESK